MHADHASPDRGRDAARPWEMSPLGWRDILLRVLTRASGDVTSIAAGGVAFYFMLAVFPLLTLVLSIYGLVEDPAGVDGWVMEAFSLLPWEGRRILADQLEQLAGGGPTQLSMAALLSLFVALWSSSQGTKALMTGLNLAYDERERRSTLRWNAAALGLLIAGAVPALVALGAIGAVPRMLAWLGAGDFTQAAVAALRWPMLGVCLMVYLAVLYRFGPSRRQARWAWVSIGAVTATVIWLGASALFSAYVSGFGAYSAMYGGIAGVVVLLMWFWLTAFAILLGAQLNAELERQTAQDTTLPPEAPMGERGAYVADHLPPTRGQSARRFQLRFPSLRKGSAARKAATDQEDL